ncbi:hypothetical protein [Hyalangium versicolor]|uniref:hypothetical protein n=1 Tax=Hyalangium versicolor TaxID=2861190 RepID=UPI001CCF373E|nr:hypothetical protein [Hyalangium versicolor]
MNSPRLLGLLLVLGLPVLAWGSMPQQTLAQLTLGADRVVLARVVDQRVNVPQGNVKQMTTISQLEVLEEYRGRGPRALELVQLGGRSGLWESHLAGDAKLAAGETALMFLRCPDPKAAAQCVLVGLAAGKQTVTAGEGGRREVEVPAQVKGGPIRRPLDEVLEEIRRATPPPVQQERGKR